MRLLFLFLVFSSVLSQCSPERTKLSKHESPTLSKANKFSEPTISNKKQKKCYKCTYVVPEKTHLTDGVALGLKPGAVICLDASIRYKSLKFINLKGTEKKPITIVNCGGDVNISVDSDKSFVIKTENCKHFRITSVGTNGSSYGIKLSGAKGLGLTLDYLSSDFEIDHIEVFDIGFAGIMAKTDPTCDDATIRGNFVMRNISLHDNYVHDTGGEGFYIGNSFFSNGMKRECGIRMPHEIQGVKVYNNIIKNSGWESIQVGSAIQNAAIYDNRIENYGTKDKPNQRGGIQIGEGTGGLCYNNFIIKGNGNGMTVLGYGDNLIFNNIIINAGLNGIFCDERFSKGSGFKFINNTIINPSMDGIRIYAEQLKMNVIANNIIVNPGNYKTYRRTFLRSGDDAYVYKLSDDVKVDLSNNYFTLDIDLLKFTNYKEFDFSLTASSPAINAGRDVSGFGITHDFGKNKRPNGEKFDIGAFEY